MHVEDYPPQEPLSPVAQEYAAEVARRAAGVIAQDYSYGKDPYQSIALVLPKKPNGSVLAMAHGGGWTSGYKEHLLFMAPAYNAAGIIFASIGYRLAPQHLFPVGLNDVAASVQWLHQHVAEFGGDPKRIFLGGHSAGGHYTALLAVKRDWQARFDLPADVIRGCLPVSGVYDFRSGSGLSVRPRFLGAENSGNDEAASPIANIQGVPTPFLMAHGSDDFPHLSRQAELMEHALKEARCDVERIVLPGRNHFSACYAAGESNGPWVPHALEWISRH